MPRKTFNNENLLYEIADAQAGLITAAQLRSLGVARSTISRRTRTGGMWTRILPAVHQVNGGNPTPLQREVAATLYGGELCVITGLAALRHVGLTLQSDDISEAVVHVLVPHEQRAASTSFVRVERTRRLPDSVRSMTRPPLRLAPPARAVADAARHLRDFGAVQTLVTEALRRQHTTLAALRAELKEAPRQGSGHLREVLALAAPDAWSPAEVDVGPLITAAGLPQPLRNHRLYTAAGRYIALPDGWFDDVGLAFEVDSDRHHAFGADLERTIRRNAAYARAGVACLPISPRDIRDNPARVIKELREAHEASARTPRPDVVAVEVSVQDAPATVPARWGG